MFQRCPWRRGGGAVAADSFNKASRHGSGAAAVEFLKNNFSFLL
jgi:hypothetical protein